MAIHPQHSAKQAEELLAIAAHDLRNSLFCIRGYAEMLLEREMPREEQAKIFQRIIACDRFAEQIVKDVLDASALENGGLAVKKTPVQLPDLVGAVIDVMAPAAASRGVVLVQAGPHPRHPVLADPVRIQQLLGNLIGNALKHVAPDSGRVEIRLHDRGSELILEVADNGSGIEPAQLERIFEKFFQGGERSRGSLGLGLYICRQIADLHGERLWAQSKGAGRGSSFFLSLAKTESALTAPRAPRKAATPPAPQRATLTLAGLRRFALNAALLALFGAGCAALGRWVPNGAWALRTDAAATTLAASSGDPLTGLHTESMRLAVGSR